MLAHIPRVKTILIAAGLMMISGATTQAWADCGGPHTCYCGQVMATAALATVLEFDEDAQTATYRVDTIFRPEGVSGVWPSVGQELIGITWGGEQLERSERVVLSLNPFNKTVSSNVVVKLEDGRLSCSGFSATGISMEQVAQMRTRQECVTDIGQTGVEFEYPDCQDSYSPFGCTSIPGKAGGLWMLLILLGLGVQKLRRPV